MDITVTLLEVLTDSERNALTEKLISGVIATCGDNPEMAGEFDEMRYLLAGPYAA